MGDIARVLDQHALDEAALKRFNGALAAFLERARVGWQGRLRTQREVADLNRIVLAQYRGPLDGVRKLAHVARPGSWPNVPARRRKPIWRSTPRPKSD